MKSISHEVHRCPCSYIQKLPNFMSMYSLSIIMPMTYMFKFNPTQVKARKFINILSPRTWCCLTQRASRQVRWRDTWQASAIFVGHIEFHDLFPFSLQFHSPVLEPGLDLSLAETERLRELHPSLLHQVATDPKLLLQFERLERRVRLTASTSMHRVRAWNTSQE